MVLTLVLIFGSYSGLLCRKHRTGAPCQWRKLCEALSSTLWARLILAPPLFYHLPLLHLLLFNHSSSIIGTFKLMMTGFALKQNIEIVPVQNILRNTLPKIKVGEW